VRKDAAMTGEITLRGRVLAVGGLKEKVIAAHRAGVRAVILPKENDKDLLEIPEKVRRKLRLVLVEHMDEVLEHALLPGSRRPTLPEAAPPQPMIDLPLVPVEPPRQVPPPPQA
jgi:ATP-dependent Lon protease